MQLVDTLVQSSIQFLSSPAWGGLGVIVSTALSTTAIILTCQSQSNRPQAKPTILKKVTHLELMSVDQSISRGIV